MTKKMLIDATHAEETRVVVVDGTRVDEFDFESLNKRQLAGNIYLAKVTRVEPSLQAAFVDYGGNRHGFLAFSEIHPDYYQIPKADREALIAEEAALAREAEEEATREKPKPRGRSRSRRRAQPAAEGAPAGDDAVVAEAVTELNAPAAAAEGLEDVPPPVGRRRRHRDRRPRRAGRRRRRGRTTDEHEYEAVGGDDAARGARRRASRAAAPLQDPGGHQGPPDPAGAGRQGGARQQGRGADHLPRRSPAATAC